MKKCSHCGETKSLADFYSDNRTPDGLKCQCKACHIEGSIRTRNKDKARENNVLYMRRAREKDISKFQKREREYSQKRARDEHYKARYILNNAIKRNRVARPEKCSVCGKSGLIEGHHQNYSMPLDVVWLCPKCHGAEHQKPARYGPSNSKSWRHSK